MLNNRKGGEDSLAVGKLGEKALHYWAEPSEESESRDSSSSSPSRRSVMSCCGQA